MKIYDKQNKLILDVTVDDNSYRNRAIMGDHNLTLYYSLPEHIEIPVGAFCVYEGETYTLMRPEQLKMKHTRQYDYTVVFSSEQEKAKIWKFRNPVDGRLKFPLTAKPKEHLQMLVDNMNRRDTGWTVGDCIDEVEKLISYDHDFCWDALSKIATEFKTEFEITGKRVSLKKVEYNKSNPLPLSYGRGNGFKPGVGRSNTSEALPVEILFVQGGDTNIDRSKYPDSEQLRAISNGCLLLPTMQTIAYDGEHFEGEDAFNPKQARRYQVDDLGLSIRNIDKELTSQAEDSLDRSDDYPKRVGTISKVEVVDKDKNYYDIIDSSIPAGLNYEDYLIGEDEMTVIFQTGELAGKEFDVKYYHNPTSSKGKTKDGRRFEITPQEIDGIMMPGASFVPRAGDTYAVFHVMLPDAYIRNDATKSGASWDMFKAAVRYLFDNEQKKFSFTGELDPIWAKKNWLNVGGQIRLGGYIQFTHEQVAPEGALVRIINIKDYVNKPHSPKIELSNDTISASVASTLKQLESAEVIIEENHNAAVQYTKRRFRDAKETIGMLEKAMLETFTQSISPISVQTMSLLVGDESLQFRFVTSLNSDETIDDSIIYDQAKKQLTIGRSYIQHMTLGIKDISSSHESSDYKRWEIAPFTSAVLSESSAKYYLYAKVSKSNQTGTFILSENAIKLEGVSGFYHLLVGVLNSEYDGERSFAALYGFTEVLPGRITTDRVVSGNGLSFFDMVNNSMKLGDKLRYNIDGDGLLKFYGVLVQSQSGIESPLGCYRGIYNSSYTYYNGDEVIYATGGLYSLYRQVNNNPCKNVPPTNTSYWQIQASAGNNGDYTSYVFKQSDTKPTTPTGTDKIPTGWSDVPTAEGRWWMSKATISGATNKATTSWSEPIQVTAEDGVDGAYTDFKYRKNQSPTSAPSITKSDRNPQNWNDNPPALDEGEYLWMSKAEINADNTLKSEWSTPVRISGEKGNNGDYTEYRFAVNGSTTASPSLTTAMKSQRNPSGWTTTQPTIAAQQYLWRITAKISGESDTLLTNWSDPIRVTPYDGKDGKSPVMLYRGVYSASKTYYGNSNRLDAVKYGDTWYIARIDAPDGTTGFSGHLPTDTNYWNSFGASFESIATNLLLAEGANIGDWFIQGGQIVSTLDSNNKILLDAANRKVQILSDNSGGSYVMDGENSATNIDIDALRGIIEARSADGYSKVAYMSPTGIFANRAGTEAMSATTGRTFRAAMVALGFANVNQSEWSLDKLNTLVMGVYGRASNSGTAQAVGGFFDKLYAHGLILHRRAISGSKQTAYLGYNDTLVIGYTSDEATVYLPSDPYEGQIIFVKQWWSGSMRFKPRTGHHIYDDSSENDYYDFGEGQGGIFVFSIGYITSGGTTTKKESWLVSRWKY